MISKAIPKIFTKTISKRYLSTYKTTPTSPSFNIILENQDLLLLSRPVTNFQMNQSLLACKQTGEAALIDSGGAPGPFVSAADKLGYEIWHLLQTHAHIDHVSGLKETKKKLPAALIYLHPLEIPVYDSVAQQSQMFGVPCELPLPAVDIDLKDGETIRVGEIELDVCLTPGHSPGHCIFSSKKHQFIIGGDLLFQGSIGRTDLPLCDASAMEDSIRKLYDLPGMEEDCIVVPGHMGVTTLGIERESNPYVKMWVK